jgi:hypothetical protein
LRLAVGAVLSGRSEPAACRVYLFVPSVLVASSAEGAGGDDHRDGGGRRQRPTSNKHEAQAHVAGCRRAPNLTTRHRIPRDTRHKPHYPLPTTHYPLPTTHYPLPISLCPVIPEYLIRPTSAKRSDSLWPRQTHCRFQSDTIPRYTSAVEWGLCRMQVGGRQGRNVAKRPRVWSRQSTAESSIAKNHPLRTMIQESRADKGNGKWEQTPLGVSPQTADHRPQTLVPLTSVPQTSDLETSRPR